MADRENDGKGNAGGAYGAAYPESTERSPGGYGEMAKGEAGATRGAEATPASDAEDDEISNRQGGSSSGDGVSRSASPAAGGGGDSTPAPDPFHASPAS